jgi:hypothetical protein
MSGSARSGSHTGERLTSTTKRRTMALNGACTDEYDCVDLLELRVLLLVGLAAGRWQVAGCSGPKIGPCATAGGCHDHRRVGLDKLIAVICGEKNTRAGEATSATFPRCTLTLKREAHQNLLHRRATTAMRGTQADDARKIPFQGLSLTRRCLRLFLPRSADAQMAQFMAAQQAEAREQVFYSFNCGICNFNSSTKTVTADPRKGKIVISMEDDGLLRLQWRLRHKDENEQQHFLFPNGATWTRVNECKDGAVFLLKMKDSNVRHFYWSQEPKNEKYDKKNAEILRKVGALIEKPPTFGQTIPKDEEEKEDDTAMTDVLTTTSVQTAGPIALVQGTGAGDAASPRTQEARGVVAHPTPGVVAGAAAGGAATGAAAGGASLSTANLMQTLTAMATELQARQESRSAAGVEDVLDADRVQPILDVDSALVNALVEYLPEGQRSPESLRAQLRSPQMQQTMTRLTQIINSSQFGQLLASLSLPVGAQTGVGLDGFIAAIQAEANKQQQGGGGGASGSQQKK